MAKLVITADFTPDPEDPMEAEYGPDGIIEALMPFGLEDIDVSVQKEDED